MRTVGRNAVGRDDWLTPPEILLPLGPFDLDPCASLHQPQPTATKMFTVKDDGLSLPWTGRVFCNPPYGQETIKWIKRLAEHGNGIALIFARTDTRCWQEYVFPFAFGILFLAGRLKFKLPGGAGHNRSGAPSALIAYGANNAMQIKMSPLRGYFVALKGARSQ